MAKSPRHSSTYSRAYVYFYFLSFSQLHFLFVRRCKTALNFSSVICEGNVKAVTRLPLRAGGEDRGMCHAASCIIDGFRKTRCFVSSGPCAATLAIRLGSQHDAPGTASSERQKCLDPEHIDGTRTHALTHAFTHTCTHAHTRNESSPIPGLLTTPRLNCGQIKHVATRPRETSPGLAAQCCSESLVKTHFCCDDSCHVLCSECLAWCDGLFDPTPWSVSQKMCHELHSGLLIKKSMSVARHVSTDFWTCRPAMAQTNVFAVQNQTVRIHLNGEVRTQACHV